jgi:hypothetical protein
MARGWESKEVESQIESRAEERARTRLRPPVEVESDAAQGKREALERGIARVQSQLASPSLHPRHRAMLETALHDLQDRLTALPSS